MKVEDLVSIVHEKKHTSNFEKMRAKGIPVYHADFHSAINNGDKIPENYFSRDSNVPSRRVQMWWIPGDGLLCLHRDAYWMVPSATVRQHWFEV